MRRLTLILPLFFVVCILSVSYSQAVTLAASSLIEDDFDTDTSADYTVAGGADGTIAFAYDYSADGIASAPNSGGSTLGVKITANDTTSDGDLLPILRQTALPFGTTLQFHIALIDFLLTSTWL